MKYVQVWICSVSCMCLVLGTLTCFALPEYIPTRMLDSFDQSLHSGTWWDSDGDKVYTRTIDEIRSPVARYGMRVDYNKSAAAWASFAVAFHQNETDNNFSGFTHVSFCVYAETPVDLLVKAEDNARASCETRVSLSAGEWRSVSLDLQRSGLELSSMANLLFFVAPGDEDASGSIVVANLALASTDLMAYISDAELRTPAINSVDLTKLDRFRAAWTSSPAEPWRGIYEVWIDTAPSFPNPLVYWTNGEVADVNSLEIGTYYLRIRAWTHFPSSFGFYGNSSSWSETKIVEIQPVRTVQILAGFEDDCPTVSSWDYDGSSVYHRDILGGQSHTGSQAMRISYTKTAGYEWSFFALEFAKECQRSHHEEDLRADEYSAMVFWAHVEQATSNDINILVRIEDRDGAIWEEEVLIRRDDSWTRLTVYPIGSAVDLSNVKRVFFFLEPGVSDVSGTIFLDDVMVVSQNAFLATPGAPNLRTQTITSYGHLLQWDDLAATGAVMYEILESDELSFTDPTVYWHMDTELEVACTEPGSLYYRVRSWSQLPGTVGQDGPWSDTVRVDHANVPPTIEAVCSYFVDDTDDEYPAGAIPRICIYEANRAQDIAKGEVEIRDSQGTLVSEPLHTTASESGQYHYVHWVTSGLAPGTYEIEARLVDVEGLSSQVVKRTIVLEAAQKVDLTTIWIARDHEVSDILVPLLRFERRFDTRWVSRDGVMLSDTVLGRGWTHTYNTWLLEYADGTVGIQWGSDGRTDLYSRTEHGYLSILHRTDVPEIERSANGGFEVSRLNDGVYSFSPDGFLESHTDSNGKTLHIEYGGHRLLKQIVGESGEMMNFFYFQNKLIKVAWSSEYYVLYAYDSEGHLRTSTNSTGEVTTYLYDSDGYLAGVDKSGSRHARFIYEQIAEISRIEGTTSATGLSVLRLPYQSALRISLIEDPSSFNQYNSSGVLEMIGGALGQTSLTWAKEILLSLRRPDTGYQITVFPAK